jgi:hypothetical protein
LRISPTTECNRREEELGAGVVTQEALVKAVCHGQLWGGVGHAVLACWHDEKGAGERLGISVAGGLQLEHELPTRLVGDQWRHGTSSCSSGDLVVVPKWLEGSGRWMAGRAASGGEGGACDGER